MKKTPEASFHSALVEKCFEDLRLQENCMNRSIADYDNKSNKAADFDTDLQIALERFKGASKKMRQDRPRHPYLIEGIVRPKSVGVLVAATGSGKTFMALNLAHACATGGQFADRFQVNKKIDVLYVYGEGEGDVDERFDAVEDQMNHDDSVHGSVISFENTPNLGDHKDVKLFIDAIKMQGFCPGLVIFDTLHNAIDGYDESSNNDMGTVIKNCKIIRNELDAVVLLVHHTGKNGEYRGASALKSDSDFFWEIDYREKDAIGTLKFSKTKYSKPVKPSKFALVDHRSSAIINWIDHEIVKYTDIQLFQFKEMMTIFQANKSQWFSVSDIERSVKGTKSNATIGRYLEQLQNNGYLYMEEKESSDGRQSMKTYKFLKKSPL